MKSFLSISILRAFFSTSINIVVGGNPYEFEWDSKKPSIFSTSTYPKELEELNK